MCKIKFYSQSRCNFSNDSFIKTEIIIVYTKVKAENINMKLTIEDCRYICLDFISASTLSLSYKWVTVKNFILNVSIGQMFF